MSLRGGLVLLAWWGATSAWAAPTVFEIDPAQSPAGFEAPYRGEATWKGSFKIQRGQLLIEPDGLVGRVRVSIDMASVDFGSEVLNNFVKGPVMFDVQQYPLAVFDGQLAEVVDGMPRRVDGVLTLHGVSKPLSLALLQVRCGVQGAGQRETCVAEVRGVFQRDHYGVDVGKLLGFDMSVTLRLKVRATAAP